MIRRNVRWLPLIGFTLVFSGCEAPLPSAPAPVDTVEQTPWEGWRAIADTPPADRDMERAVTLTAALAQAPGGLEPMVDFLGDPAVAAEQKVVALICLTTQRDHLAPHEARLSEWTKAGQDLELRKFATHALGMVNTPGAVAGVAALLEDEARPVRETAMGVLLSFRPDQVQHRLQAFWDDPETSPAIREQVLLGMPPHLVEPFIGLYAASANDLRLSSAVRQKSVNVLGQLGNATHLAIVKQCAEQDPDEAVKSTARGALALLESANGDGAPVAPSVPPA